MSSDITSFGFPKSSRILKRSDFRKVYDEGTRYTCQYFAAFYSVWPDQVDGPKVGFTVSKAMGKAVVRNRMKRRMREAVRLNLALLPSKFAMVFNPRKPVLAAEAPAIELEVARLFRKCANL